MESMKKIQQDFAAREKELRKLFQKLSKEKKKK